MYNPCSASHGVNAEIFPLVLTSAAFGEDLTWLGSFRLETTTSSSSYETRLFRDLVEDNIYSYRASLKSLSKVLGGWFDALSVRVGNSFSCGANNLVLVGEESTGF